MSEEQQAVRELLIAFARHLGETNVLIRGHEERLVEAYLQTLDNPPPDGQT